MHRGAGLALASFVWTATAVAEDLPAALQPGADEKIELRVRVIRHGPAYLGADAAKPMPLSEPPEPIASDTEVTLPALAPADTTARRVAVLLGRGSAVRLIVHLPVAYLALVATDGAHVFSDAASAREPDAGFVALHAGFRLKSRAKGPWLPVRHRDEDVALDGVLPRAQVGYAYRETAVFSEPGNAEVSADARLLSRPGGRVLARLLGRKGDWTSAVRVGAPQRGHQRVRVSFPLVQIEGWVKSNLVRPVDGSGAGGSWGYGRDSGLQGGTGAKRIPVPAGTRLREAPGQPVVGIVVKPTDLELVRQDPGRPPIVRIHTDFGDADLSAGQ